MPTDQRDGSDDGWTHIGRKKGARPTFTRPVDFADKDLTIEKIINDFDKKMQIWRRSPCRKEALEMLSKYQPDDGWQIEKAICLGSGSFSRDNLGCRKRTMFQFALFMDVVEHLQKLASVDIECFAQDPKYTALDNEFLSGLGVITLEVSLTDVAHGMGPAKQHLGSQSVVFDLFIDMGPPQMRDLFTCNQKLYIGSDMHGRVVGGNNMSKYAGPFKEHLDYVPEHHVAQVQQESNLVTQFHADYRACRWPRFEEDPTIFEGLAMYWQEPKDEDDET